MLIKISAALVATTLLAIAVAPPVLAQSAPSTAQQAPQNGGTFHGYPLGDWYRTDSW
jgi:hypothetical protein